MMFASWPGSVPQPQKKKCGNGRKPFARPSAEAGRDRVARIRALLPGLRRDDVAR